METLEATTADGRSRFSGIRRVSPFEVSAHVGSILFAACSGLYRH